jgi:hypothetical protein
MQTLRLQKKDNDVLIYWKKYRGTSINVQCRKGKAYPAKWQLTTLTPLSFLKKIFTLFT